MLFLSFLNFCLLTSLLLSTRAEEAVTNGNQDDNLFTDNLYDASEEIENLLLERYASRNKNENTQDGGNSRNKVYQMTDEEILQNLQFIEDDIDNNKNDNMVPDSNQQIQSTRDPTTGKRSKILFIPSTINSHVIVYGQVGQQLAKLGHDVEILVPSFMPDYFHNDRNFVATKYKVDRNVSIMASDTLATGLLDIALSKSFWYQYYKILVLEKVANREFQEDCRRLIYDKDLMHYLENGKFDFVVTGIFAIHCYNIVPFKLKIPFGFLALPFVTSIFGVPRLPSVTPFFGMKATNRMDFYERFACFAQEMAYIFLKKVECVDCKDFLTEDFQDAKQMITLASAWFYLEDLSITYPSVNQPNTLSVGSIISSAVETKPLPRELEEFVSTNNEGTILVSFGSYFDNVPEYLGNIFCRVFKNRSKNKIIWKMKYTPSDCKSLSNLKIVSWLPQVDILAHPNTILFITHGGFNSLVEALHHQVVMVILPIALDQKTNSAAVADKGYAIALELGSEDLENELEANIETILRDESYRKNIEKYSKLLRYKSVLPEVEISRLIDHIVEFGDEHLRSSAIGMPIWQLYMFDIFLFLLALLFAVLIIFIIILRCVFKYFKYKLKNKIKTS